jgi:hypothetical protein
MSRFASQVTLSGTSPAVKAALSRAKRRSEDEEDQE